MMSWFTKTVVREKVVEKIVDRPLIGAPTAVAIYTVSQKSYVFGIECEQPLGYYLSCADAFSEHPGASVKERKGVLLDGEYFVFPAGTEAVKVKKPKRGKGKA